jgi:3-deoxy-D-manno-octulosonic-acid transferase
LQILYNIATYIAVFHLKIAASFNSKLKLGILGRAQTFKTLRSKLKPQDKVIWLHCASLGEYEQGLPVFEVLKKEYPEHKIVLSFFSPSGYEIRKNTPIADAVVYLPFDTPKNVNTFLDLIQPSLVIFVKYEVWPNYLKALKKHGIQTVLISALFRKNQLYFKPYGRFMRNVLKSFNHIFTQDNASKTLLTQHGILDVSVAGDTRFDRVSNQLVLDNQLEFIKEFKQDVLCIVAGSTWPEDEKLLVPFINASTNTNLKFIIAPHNIKSQLIKNLRESIRKPTVLFSEMESQNLKDASVFILDTIGLLTKVYNYADIAYIGGAMGSTGLHNTLEAAVFGVPIIIGKNYKHFPEAKAMLDAGGLISINDLTTLTSTIETLIDTPEKSTKYGASNKVYIEKNKGAVIQITTYLRTYLNN